MEGRKKRHGREVAYFNPLGGKWNLGLPRRMWPNQLLLKPGRFQPKGQIHELRAGAPVFFLHGLRKA